MALAPALVACCGLPRQTKPVDPSPAVVSPDLRDWLTAGGVRDSAWLAVDRRQTAWAGYGLYSVLLTRSASPQAGRVLAELLSSSTSATEAAIARRNLNLVALPTRDAAAATALLASARAEPAPTASTLLQRHHDYRQAALLLASVCRPARGAAVMQACGSATPDGPILVTTLRELDPAAPPGQRLLIVNFGNASPAAVAEIIAAYRRQVMRRDFDDRAGLDGWRLSLLSAALDAARLLPGIRKAYAGEP